MSAILKIFVCFVSATVRSRRNDPKQPCGVFQSGNYSVIVKWSDCSQHLNAAPKNGENGKAFLGDLNSNCGKISATKFRDKMAILAGFGIANEKSESNVVDVDRFKFKISRITFVFSEFELKMIGAVNRRKKWGRHSNSL
jgi:hypothetical protein